MSKLKIAYEIAGRRYDKEGDFYYYGGNKQSNSGEIYEEDVAYGDKYNIILSYVNLENQKIKDVLLEFAKQEVEEGKAVDNQFIINLKISDAMSNRIHVDIHFDIIYSYGTLIPISVFQRLKNDNPSYVGVVNKSNSSK